MSATVGGALERGIFVDGRAHALEGEALTITNPGTGELVGRAASASPEAVDAAVRSAQAALPEWSRRGYADRGTVLHACAQAFADSVDDLVPLLVAEQGKTIREARIELRKAADTLEHYAGMGRDVRGVSVPGLAPGVDGRVLRRPLGVVAAIVPWNFPTTLLCNKLGPALLCGNTVVAKPADTTPFTTLRLAEILTEAGLPPGVVNVVPGTGPGAGEALVTHRLVRKVAFTGSTPTGERVGALAAAGSKRVTLELGGSDPMIICDDADLDRAASAASMAASTTAAKPALPSSGCSCSNPWPMESSTRSRPRRPSSGSGWGPIRRARSAPCTPSATGRSCSASSTPASRRGAR